MEETLNTIAGTTSSVATGLITELHKRADLLYIVATRLNNTEMDSLFKKDSEVVTMNNLVTDLVTIRELSRELVDLSLLTSRAVSAAKDVQRLLKKQA